MRMEPSGTPCSHGEGFSEHHTLGPEAPVPGPTQPDPTQARSLCHRLTSCCTVGFHFLPLRPSCCCSGKQEREGRIAFFLLVHQQHYSFPAHSETLSQTAALVFTSTFDFALIVWAGLLLTAEWHGAPLNTPAVDRLNHKEAWAGGLATVWGHLLLSLYSERVQCPSIS